MIDITYCDKRKCKLNIQRCNRSPTECAFDDAKRSISDLLEICHNYKVADGAPDIVIEYISKAEKVLEDIG